MIVLAKDSQLWPFLYWLTSLGALTFVLWMTASHFDRTEGKAIAGQAVAIIDVIRKRWAR